MEFIAGTAAANVDLIYGGLARLPHEGEEMYAQDFHIEMGGGISATLVNLSRLNVPVRFSTFLGGDIFSEFIRSQLKEYGIPYENHYHGKGIPLSVSTDIVTGKDRCFVSYRDTHYLEQVDEELVYQNLRGARIVDMSWEFLEVNRRLKRDGSIMVFDCSWRDDLSLQTCEKYLEVADFFVPNQKEAMKLTNTSSPHEAAIVLSDRFEHVIIKLDKDGCLYRHAGKERLIPPKKSTVLRDPTGAGDAFLSGFLYGLYHGWAVEDSVSFGNLTGGRCVEGIGCLSSYYTEQELLRAAGKEL